MGDHSLFGSDAMRYGGFPPTRVIAEMRLLAPAANPLLRTLPQQNSFGNLACRDQPPQVACDPVRRRREIGSDRSSAAWGAPFNKQRGTVPHRRAGPIASLLERFWQARHPPRYAAFKPQSSPSSRHSSREGRQIGRGIALI